MADVGARDQSEGPAPNHGFLAESGGGGHLHLSTSLILQIRRAPFCDRILEYHGYYEEPQAVLRHACRCETCLEGRDGRAHVLRAVWARALWRPRTQPLSSPFLRERKEVQEPYEQGHVERYVLPVYEERPRSGDRA
jgi:hypothetical protein